MKAGNIVCVALPVPLARTFDYLLPDELAPPAPGCRVRVPFGRQSKVGLVLDVTTDTDIPAEKLKRITAVIDQRPCIDTHTLALLRWAADYYHHPIGEVIFTALPKPLRDGKKDVLTQDFHWRVTRPVDEELLAALARAPRQRALLHWIQHQSGPVSAEQLNNAHQGWRPIVKALVDKQLLERVAADGSEPPASSVAVTLTPLQQEVSARIATRLGAFSVTLLEGVTGSGKTEVYLQLIKAVLAAGKQALVLLPEIGLTPQMAVRFRERLATASVVIHSGVADGERYRIWRRFANGELKVVIGTRSAVFVPMQAPGIIIVDEEHDPSYKQQDGFRYSARDLAVARGRQLGIPVVLGTATPALETVENAQRGRYHQEQLHERISGGEPPRIEMLDVRNLRLNEGLSQPLLAAIAATLARQEQVLLFINQRGFAPVMICHDCGWHARCERCDAHLTWHHRSMHLRCHHCGHQRLSPTSCPDCTDGKLVGVGHGTERVERALATPFPGARIARIDRDSTRRKGELETLFAKVHAGELDILVGTQMLAKGHHFPNLTLVGILDADGGLFSSDFRALERLAQLLVQVAGRAGRGTRPGRVLVQTHHPEHPSLLALADGDYRRFADAALAERRETALPPFGHVALLRAESVHADAALAFLDAAARLATPDEVFLLGPAPSPMEKRAGRFRAQLLLQAARRAPLHTLLRDWLPRIGALPDARKVRWSVDVDPLDLS